MPGQTAPNLNKYFNLGLKKCGTNLCGLYSAEYSLSQNIRSVFPFGKDVAIAQYSELPNIELTYSQYLDSAGTFNGSEFNTITKLELANRKGSVICDMALLSKITYDFNIDGPFLVTKNYLGFYKPSSGSASSKCSSTPRIFRRIDYTGTVPNGIDSSALISVQIEIAVNRQLVPELSTRKPYAAYVTFPVVSTITFECYTEGVDTYTIDAFSQSCGQKLLTKNTFTASACGKSIQVKNAVLSNLSYSGADAGIGSKPQTVRASFVSHDTPAGLKPVYIFPDSASSC